MKPQKYIEGKPIAMAYFKQFEKILKKRGMDDEAYSSELSRLSNECFKYEDCQTRASDREADGKPGFFNEFDNDTIQVNALHTISKDASAAIDKLVNKFGFTPSDFSKIKDLVKEDEEEDEMDALMTSDTMNHT